jgi:hypothetical protein
MKKPRPPSKTHLVEHCETITHWDQAMTLPEFLAWIKSKVPKKSIDDAHIEVELDCGYYEDYTAYFHLFWRQEEPNPNYDRNMASYAKKLAKWEKEQNT